MRRIAALAALMLLAGCTPTGESTSSPSTSAETTSASATPSPSPSSSPSPTVVQSFPSDLPTVDDESAAIIAAWQKYWEVYEKYMADPNGFTDFTETQYVTTGEASTTILKAISNLRDNDWQSLGGRVFRDVKVTVNTVDAHMAGTATVTYCQDTNGIELVDAAGDPVERTGMTLQETASMEQGRDGVWRVAMIRNEKAEC